MRTLESLHADHARFQSEGGGHLKKAKLFNNAIHAPFFDITLEHVSKVGIPNKAQLHVLFQQISLPALHVTLGIFLRLFDLLEQECHQFDVKLASKQQSTSTPSAHSFQSFAAALQSSRRLSEEIAQKKQAVQVLDQGATYLGLTLSQGDSRVQMVLQAAAHCQQKILNLVSGQFSVNTCSVYRPSVLFL